MESVPPSSSPSTGVKPVDTGGSHATTNLVTLVFTDVVGSTALKQSLGDRAAAALLEEHDQLLRDVLAGFFRGQEIGTAGDSFFLAFTTPSEAVRFALVFQARLREANDRRGVRVMDRIGIHLGEIVVKEAQSKLQSKDLYGLSLDTCARVMGLAEGGRILLTRPVFDSARQMLRREEIPGVRGLRWASHGRYSFKGIEEPMEVCEVAEEGAGELNAPESGEKATRVGETEVFTQAEWPPPPETVLLGRYKVGLKLGAGGMGSVSAALDLNLHREVALKFLPATVGGDRELEARFKREARALAALNHPNVITVFSVEETRSRHFIVMELVKGQPLSRAIPNRGLPLSDFYRIAIPLVEALAAAHHAGIIHRDLKPSNVMLTDDHRVKVIDFGLAKIVSANPSAGNPTPESTLVLASSAALGTPDYMSPEQAQGLAMDSRTDVFSLGIVLYEMLAGRRPFVGDSAAMRISSILRDDPEPIASLRPDVPPALAQVIHRCLEKKLALRVASVDEVLGCLHGLATPSSSGNSSGSLSWVPSGPGRDARPGRATGRWVAAGLAAAVVLAAGIWGLPRLVRGPGAGGTASPAAGARDGAARPNTMRFITPHPVLVGTESDEWPSPSPDGKQLAFVRRVNGFQQIFVRDLEGERPARQLSTEPLDHIEPRWSPDGREIVHSRSAEGQGPGIRPSDVWGGFYAPDLLDVWALDMATGKSRRLVEEAGGARFGSQGKLAFCKEVDGHSRIWISNRDGTQRRPVTEDDDTVAHLEPAWSPDGLHLVYRRLGEKSASSLAVVNLETRQSTNLTANQFLSEPVWSPSGRYIYFSANLASGFNLWRMPVNAGASRAGPFEPVTFGIGRDLHPAFSADGKRLFYSIVTWNSDLWALPMDPAKGQAAGPPFPLIESTREDTRGDWSADSRRIVFTSDRGGEMNLYVAGFDPATRQVSNVVQVTSGPGGDYQASWSPSGRHIAFYSRRAGNEDIWLVELAADGTAAGPPTQLTKDPASDINPVFSPDGLHIAFMSDRTGQSLAYVMKADGSGQRALSEIRVGGHYMRWMDTDSVVVPGAPVRVLFLDGRDPIRLSARPYGIWAAHLTASPDRRFFADNNHTSLMLWDRETGLAQTNLFTFPNPTVGVDYTVWSPDGRFILFDRNEPQGGDLYELRDPE